jgi:hypothetical protein
MNLFNNGKKLVIGMVHLLPLLGSPKYRGSIETIINEALTDAHSLAEECVDAILVENFGDLPYPVDQTPLVSALAMARVIGAVTSEIKLPIGINVRFNDYRCEIAMALVFGAKFVRVEGFVDNLLTDSGFIPACAASVMRYRHEIGAKNVEIWADVQVKEATTLGNRVISESASAAERNFADAIVVTGQATGLEPSTESLELVRRSVQIPIIAGSGVNSENVKKILPLVDGVIVGTAFKKDGKVENRVDRAMVRKFMNLIKV